jgi:S-adenosylmethionine synthetase
MTQSFLFTSESVSEGHPDKLADQISDTFLDAFLSRDAQAKVACESFVARDLVVVGGEFRSHPPELVDQLREQAPETIRNLLREIGYRGDFPGIDPENCEILLRWNRQSDDIHQGVDRQDGDTGAGDQGLMFGYASDETAELMPLPIQMAHRLVQRQSELRRSGALPWLRPDAKAQVTVRYEDQQPVAITQVVLSTQHAGEVDGNELREAVRRDIIEAVVPAGLRSPDIRYHINPTGRFEIGGPEGDAGLTGRKIIVDTYGGRCPHGGGAFSGKDPTKVDRSAAYMARHVAKNVVAAGLARRCTVQIAYAIGVAEPVSLLVDLHGSGEVAERDLQAAIRRVFDLTPAGIIASLDLRRPLYRQTAAYGHFGRDDLSLPWEKTDRVDDLLAALGGDARLNRTG